jgi:hypothetical protein
MRMRRRSASVEMLTRVEDGWWGQVMSVVIFVFERFFSEGERYIEVVTVRLSRLMPGIVL